MCDICNVLAILKEEVQDYHNEFEAKVVQTTDAKAYRDGHVVASSWVLSAIFEKQRLLRRIHSSAGHPVTGNLKPGDISLFNIFSKGMKNGSQVSHVHL